MSIILHWTAVKITGLRIWKKHYSVFETCQHPVRTLFFQSYEIYLLWLTTSNQIIPFLIVSSSTCRGTVLFYFLTYFLFSISILDYALIWVWSTIYNLFFSTKKLLLFRKKSWCKACTYTVTRFYVLHSCYNVNCNVFSCFFFLFFTVAQTSTHCTCFVSEGLWVYVS